MAKVAKVANALGNTRPKRIVPSREWCFTLNNYTEEEMANLAKSFEEEKCEFIIGEEVGEQGTPHLQGWIKHPKIIRPMEKFKNPRIHWEKCKGNREQNIDYCSKDGKYTTNVLTKNEKKRKLGIIENLYPWQKETIEKLLASNDREILWRWDPTGNTGKTALAKLLIFEHNALMIDGKKSDILHGATDYVNGLGDTLFEKPIIFILDLSRTIENYVSYDCIEKLKNGLWFSGKYEGKMVMIPPPKVIIFANFPPDKTKLSADRWNIQRIGEESQNGQNEVISVMSNRVE